MFDDDNVVTPVTSNLGYLYSVPFDPYINSPNNAVYVFKDGIARSKFTLCWTFPANQQVMVYNGGTYYYFGNNGTVSGSLMGSTDGVNWFVIGAFGPLTGLSAASYIASLFPVTMVQVQFNASTTIGLYSLRIEGAARL